MAIAPLVSHSRLAKLLDGNNNGHMHKGLFKLTPAISTALSIFLGVLFLAYCTVYLCACPSQALACAVCAEIVGLIVSIAIIRSNIFSIPETLLKKIPVPLKSSIESLSGILSSLKLLVLSAITFLAIADFAALCLSLCGLHVPAIALYTTLPVSYWMGLHPAFSLEMLAGALVENNSFERAEPLFLEVKKIRIKLTGPESSLASAVYADLGDLYVRKHDLSTAEYWYRRSVALGAHTGRSYTGLATVLRESGSLDESQKCYLKALSLRKLAFGESSKQYKDTLRGYSRLQQLLKARRAGPSVATYPEK